MDLKKNDNVYDKHQLKNKSFQVLFKTYSKLYTTMHEASILVFGCCCCYTVVVDFF
jgi:hypothetical protein